MLGFFVLFVCLFLISCFYQIVNVNWCLCFCLLHIYKEMWSLIIQSGILRMINILEINFLKKDFMYLYSVFFSKRLEFKSIVHTNPPSSMCDWKTRLVITIALADLKTLSSEKLVCYIAQPMHSIVKVCSRAYTKLCKMGRKIN